MSINESKIKYTEENVKNKAPEEHGVYGIYDPINIVVYYGKSEKDKDNGIQGRLLDHLNKNGDEYIPADCFNFEICEDADSREKELIAEHKRNNNGKRPKYNDKL